MCGRVRVQSHAIIRQACQIRISISNETETQTTAMRKEIEKGLKDELSTFTEKMELSFKNEQKALQTPIELLKSENSSFKLQR